MVTITVAPASGQTEPAGLQDRESSTSPGSIPYSSTIERSTASARALAVAASGANGVTVLPLHLRPGARQWWLAWLARTHPHLLPLYRELYGRGAYAPRRYREALHARVAPLLARHGLACVGPDPEGQAAVAAAIRLVKAHRVAEARPLLEAQVRALAEAGCDRVVHPAAAVSATERCLMTRTHPGHLAATRPTTHLAILRGSGRHRVRIPATPGS